MNKKEIVLTLFDNEENRRQSKCMNNIELLANDISNPNSQSFWDSLDDFIKWGKTYKITIEEV